MLKSHSEPDPIPARRRRRKRLVTLTAAGVLLLSPAAAVAGRHAVSAAKTQTADAIAAVLASGVMTGAVEDFRPGGPATRGTLARALHRSMPRLAATSLDDIGAGGTLTSIGSAALKVDGAPGGRQGVLVSVQMQLDYDDSMRSMCRPTFQLTHDDTQAVLGVWDHEFEPIGTDAGGLETNIAFSFVSVQPAGTSYDYHLLAINDCEQDLYTDRDIMTVQSFPLDGSGAAIVPSAKGAAPTVRPHDR